MSKSCDCVAFQLPSSCHAQMAVSSCSSAIRVADSVAGSVVLRRLQRHRQLAGQRRQRREYPRRGCGVDDHADLRRVGHVAVARVIARDDAEGMTAVSRNVVVIARLERVGQQRFPRSAVKRMLQVVARKVAGAALPSQLEVVGAEQRASRVAGNGDRRRGRVDQRLGVIASRLVLQQPVIVEAGCPELEAAPVLTQIKLYAPVAEWFVLICRFIKRGVEHLKYLPFFPATTTVVSTVL